MKKYGVAILCSAVAIISILLTYHLTKVSEDHGKLSVNTVYAMAKDAGYDGTLEDFVSQFRGISGKDGVGISSAKIDADGHLIITYTDNSTVDAGIVNAEKLDVSANVSGASLNYALMSTVSIFSRLSDSNFSIGSGSIYKLDKSSGDAYIITNYHIVYDAVLGNCVPDENITVYLYGMEYPMYAINAKFVGGSASYDIAVLKITGSETVKNSNALCARFGNSEDLEVLDTVIAVGNPGGNGTSVTQGKVNIESENRYVNIGASGGKTFMRVIRFDAAVNTGNSGGGLFNKDGELVGIVTAKDKGDGVDNVAYAVPINLALSVAGNIMRYCDGTGEEHGRILKLGIGLDVKSATVGYDEIKDMIAKREIVAISSVAEGSFAEKAGIKAGDVILSICVDGVEYDITREYQAPELTLLAKENGTIVYNLLRGEEKISCTIEVPAILEKIP